jgi:hypothetical protein
MTGFRGLRGTSCGSSRISERHQSCRSTNHWRRERSFRLAAQDTFDRGTIALAAAFAGESQFSRSNPSFGEGAEA